MNTIEANEILRALAHYSMSIAGFLGLAWADSGVLRGRIYVDADHVYNFVILPDQFDLEQWLIMVDSPRDGLHPANEGSYLTPLTIPRTPTPDPQALAERKRHLATILPLLSVLEPTLLHRTEFYSILDFLGVPPELTELNAITDHLCNQYAIRPDESCEQGQSNHHSWILRSDLPNACVSGSALACRGDGSKVSAVNTAALEDGQLVDFSKGRPLRDDLSEERLKACMRPSRRRLALMLYLVSGWTTWGMNLAERSGHEQALTLHGREYVMCCGHVLRRAEAQLFVDAGLLEAGPRIGGRPSLTITPAGREWLRLHA